MDTEAIIAQYLKSLDESIALTDRHANDLRALRMHVAAQFGKTTSDVLGAQAALRSIQSKGRCPDCASAYTINMMTTTEYETGC